MTRTENIRRKGYVIFLGIYTVLSIRKSLGDCNLFLNDPEDDCCGEIEVMIAEPRARLKGCATEALKLLMGYCYDTIRISKFVAKIGKHNLKSYSLFKNKVGFISALLWHHMNHMI